eukprot:m.107865 g.107865  ORF g.107865 m.107865 type:complete len:162 (-) comp27824_c0_seq3:85-570(-)
MSRTIAKNALALLNNSVSCAEAAEAVKKDNKTKGKNNKKPKEKKGRAKNAGKKPNAQQHHLLRRKPSTQYSEACAAMDRAKRVDIDQDEMYRFNLRLLLKSTTKTKASTVEKIVIQHLGRRPQAEEEIVQVEDTSLFTMAEEAEAAEKKELGIAALAAKKR